MGTLSFMFIVHSIFLFFFKPSFAVDTITKSESLSDGRTLVSKEGKFELGFFTPASSKNRYYLGIWYKNIPVRTIVWVANRSNPTNDSSGAILMINSTGSLVLSQNKTVVWSTTTSSLKQSQNPVLQLLDSGNLVVKDEKDDGNGENYLWQSFDYPCDTLLPGMKFGWDSKSGLNRRLSAWKSLDDPAPGDFIYEIERRHNYPDAVMFKADKKYSRVGPWNGLHFSGAGSIKPNPLFQFKFVFNKDEAYYVYNLKNNAVISRLVLNQTNYVIQRSIWVEATQAWDEYSHDPKDTCDNYNLCGAYGNCVTYESPICQCLQGFKAKSQDSWNPESWSKGCIRNDQLSCHKDGFIKFVRLKLPDTTYSNWLSESMNLQECRDECLKNCSCMAYTNSDIRGEGRGCVLWHGDLIDIKQFSDGGQDLYIRMPVSQSVNREGEKGKQNIKVVITIVVVVIAIISGMLIVAYCIYKSRSKSKEKNGNTSQNNKDLEEDMELALFDLSTIARATDNFSFNNRLGEGGFGPVYMGVLVDGQEIAVKRLSRSSEQGLNEFKNEVILIAKLQHRNLVKLLGCCIEGQEKMLVYEYMPNKSLDFLIFDQNRAKELDWSKRFQIICGIARGLLYLHQDSRLRIIHRDLKASNVLLDSEMNPKISDFGLARIFGGNQTEGNTKKVVGTYGYMAPEYAFDGLFSTKSDVFSYGILLLEIVSGKKNRGFYHQDNRLNLIRDAWRLWKEGRPLEVLDASLGDSHVLSEVLRCIHVSLLCVQQNPKDRPNMSSVVLMLSSESALPQPKQPGFFIERDSHEAHSSSSKRESSSTNEITVTILEPR